MNPEKWQKIKAIFNDAVELSPDELEILLRRLNETDTEILTEVRRLLASEKVNKLEAPLVKLNYFSDDNDSEHFIGKQIGNYKITREIGRGGMGIVFEAVRRNDDDFAQIVALKLLKRGMDSATLVRRFRHERQILASLEHPNIARLLDGGMTEDGMPFFAMEFINGRSINDYCHEQNLNTIERLVLFLQVCAAVSFAHSRLVVHRDLKPSNIIITADGIVKLLDFGIAKILSSNDELPNQTETLLGMMTPAYASPEQIKGEIVSTLSDVYSLGLILYEILTGVSAYQFPNKRPDEIAKVICESDPPRPSSVVSGQWSLFSRTKFKNRQTNKNEQTTNRKSKIQNPKSLRGDLDNIILKALRKEAPRRYASVEQFAGDISRHLTGLPVLARPDTFIYRFEKFVKRNRVYVMTAFLILLTLIGGIAATGWQAYQAEKQRKLAEDRFNQVRALANNIVFKYYDEAEKLPNSTPLREMFVKDSLNYFDSLATDKNADDGLRTELGKAFLRIAKVQGRPTSPNLGDTVGAIENYRKGIEIIEPLVLNSTETNLHSDLISAYSDYAMVLKQNGKLTESKQILQKSISVGEKFLAQNPANDILAARLAGTYLVLGDSLPIGADESDNLHIYKKAYNTCDNLLKIKPDALLINNYLVAAAERMSLNLITLAKSAHSDENTVLEKQYLQEAKTLLERNIEIAEKLVRLYPDQILTPALLASVQLSYGTLLIELEDNPNALNQVRKAEKFYRKSFAMDQVSVGQKIEVSMVEQKLGIIYLRTGEIAKAEPLFAHAFELLDYLVEKDAENFDYVKIRGEAKFDYGDELLRRSEIGKARQTYEHAFNEILIAAQIKDFNFANSLPGLFHEKIGNCYLAESAKDGSNIKKAIFEYQKAVEIWRKYGALNISGIQQNNKITILEKKINYFTNLVH